MMSEKKLSEEKKTAFDKQAKTVSDRNIFKKFCLGKGGVK